MGKEETPMTPEEAKLAALAKKLLLAATDEAGIAKAIRFRNDLIAARKVIPKFNEALIVMRDIRGADYATGVERIVLRDTSNDSGKGAPKLSEEERLKRILG